MRFIFFTLLLFISANSLFYAKNKDDSTKLRFYYGAGAGVAFLNTNLPSTTYDLKDDWGLLLLPKFSLWFKSEFCLDQNSIMNLNEFGLYSNLNIDFISNTNSRTIEPGSHFFEGELSPVFLDSKLETRLNMSNFNFGFYAKPFSNKFKTSLGLNIGYIFDKNVNLNTKLRNNEIEIINPIENVHYTNSISDWYLAVNLNLSYEVFRNEQYSINLFINNNLGLNNLTNYLEKKIHLNGLSLGIAARFNFDKQDTIIIPPPSPVTTKFRVNYEIDNLKDKSLNSSILSNEEEIQRIFIYHSKVYYYDNNEELPEYNLNRLTQNQRSGYVSNRNSGLNHFNGFTKFYEDILNQVGFELSTNPASSLSLLYSNSSSNRSVMKKRADYLKEYLEDIWYITANRIIIRANRDVKNNIIQLSSPFLSRLVECPITKEYIIDSKITFNIEYPPDKIVNYWELRIQHFSKGNLIRVFDTTGTNKDDKIAISFLNRNDIVISNDNRIEYYFKVYYSDGSSDNSIDYCEIKFIDSDSRKYYIEGRLSDLQTVRTELLNKISNKNNFIIEALSESVAEQVSKMIDIKNYKCKQFTDDNSFHNDIFRIIFQD